MKEQLYCKIGTYAYPIPPVCDGTQKALAVRLVEGGEGYVTVGSHVFPIKGGCSLIRTGDLDDGVYTVRFVIGEQRLESDPIRVHRGACSILMPSRDTVARERVEHAKLCEKIYAHEQSLEKLEQAVFRTTIF